MIIFLFPGPKQFSEILFLFVLLTKYNRLRVVRIKILDSKFK